MADEHQGNSLLSATVVLRSGEVMPKTMVYVVITSLQFLLETKAIVFYELVMSCRNREHVFFGKTGEMLVELGLVERLDTNGCGIIHDMTRRIVVASAEGDEAEMYFVNPIAR